MTRPTLAGRRVLLTRAAEQAGPLAALLEERGARVVSVPVLAIEGLLDGDRLGELHRAISRGDWDDLVLSSRNAVGFLPPPPAEPGPRLFAIGPGTAAAAEAVGWSPEPLPDESIAESLAELLVASGVSGRRVLLPRAEGAREVLPLRLRQAGALVEEVVLYRTVAAQGGGATLRSALAPPEPDAVVFMSASAVSHFVELLGGIQVPRGVLVACIGPITARAARGAGMGNVFVAGEHSLLGLVGALERELGPLSENGPRR